MPFNRPTLKELVDGIFNDAVAWMRSESPILRNSLVGVLSRVFGGAVHILYGVLDRAWKQYFIHLCDDETLDYHGVERGIPRKDSRTAQGNAIGVGKDGATVPAGTKVQLASDHTRLYTVAEDAAVKGGGIMVLLVAAQPGAQGNLPAGAKLSFMRPIPDILFNLTVDEKGIAGGVDVEKPDPYRARLLDDKRNPPHGGNANDYKRWALEVSGVDRAWPLPKHAGLGTVGVMIARAAEYEDIIPDADTIERCRRHIEAQRPVGGDAWVFPPTLKPIDITLRIVPNSYAIQDAVRAEMRDFFARDGAPDSFVYHSRLRQAISAALGEHHHYLESPTADILIGKTELPVMGNLAFVSPEGGVY